MTCRFPFIVSQHSHDSPGQVVGVGRCPCLVEHHIQSGPALRQAEHRLHEIPPVLAVEPRRPDDHVVAPAFNYIVLPFKLGRSVYPRRCAFLLLPARSVVRVPAEHVVRGDVHQQAAGLFHRLREYLRGFRIQPAAKGPVALRLVHVGVGRAVDYTVDAVFLYRLPYGCRIRDVKNHRLQPSRRDYVREYVCVTAVLADKTHLPAKLAVRPGYQYVHIAWSL